MPAEKIHTHNNLVIVPEKALFEYASKLHSIPLQEGKLERFDGLRAAAKQWDLRTDERVGVFTLKSPEEAARFARSMTQGAESVQNFCDNRKIELKAARAAVWEEFTRTHHDMTPADHAKLILEEYVEREGWRFAVDKKSIKATEKDGAYSLEIPSHKHGKITVFVTPDSADGRVSIRLSKSLDPNFGDRDSFNQFLKGMGESLDIDVQPISRTDKIVLDQKITLGQESFLPMADKIQDIRQTRARTDATMEAIYRQNPELRTWARLAKAVDKMENISSADPIPQPTHQTLLDEILTARETPNPLTQALENVMQEEAHARNARAGWEESQGKNVLEQILGDAPAQPSTNYPRNMEIDKPDTPALDRILRPVTLEDILAEGPQQVPLTPSETRAVPIEDVGLHLFPKISLSELDLPMQVGGVQMNHQQGPWGPNGNPLREAVGKGPTPPPPPKPAPRPKPPELVLDEEKINTVTNKLVGALDALPPAKEGHVYLFRGEVKEGKGLRETNSHELSPEKQAAKAAQGRWYGLTMEDALFYVHDRGDPRLVNSVQISYVEVPLETARRYNVANMSLTNPAEAGAIKASANVNGEFFLPAEIAEAKSTLVAFTAEEIDSFKPQELEKAGRYADLRSGKIAQESFKIIFPEILQTSAKQIMQERHLRENDAKDVALIREREALREEIFGTDRGRYFQPTHEIGNYTILPALAQNYTAQTINKMPEARQELIEGLKKLGYRGLEPIGHGSYAITFHTTENQIIRIALDGTESPRKNLPYVLQPIETHTIGNFKIEVLPEVDTAGVTEQHARAIYKKALQDGLLPWDIIDHKDRVRTSNIGLLPDGTPVVLDADAIHTYVPGKSRKSPQELEKEYHTKYPDDPNPEEKYQWEEKGKTKQEIHFPHKEVKGVVPLETLERVKQTMQNDSVIIKLFEERGLYSEEAGKALQVIAEQHEQQVEAAKKAAKNRQALDKRPAMCLKKSSPIRR